MHLICINHNNIINKPFSAKKGRSNTLHMCLDMHAKFRGDRTLRGRDLKGGSIPPPPPSKNLLSKSPVKIGLNPSLLDSFFFMFSFCVTFLSSVCMETSGGSKGGGGGGATGAHPPKIESTMFFIH